MSKKIMFFSVVVCLIATTNTGQSKELLLEFDGEIVRVDRDDFGVPYVRSDSTKGLYFGNGYAIAQDRLVQMENFRRAAKGTLAEVLGSEAVERDKQARILGYTEEERLSQFNELDYEMQIMISSYVEGVNRWVDECVSADKLPRWFNDIGLKPERWTVTDVVAIAQMMARRFGESGGTEARNLEVLAYLKQKLGDKDAAWDVFNDLFPIVTPTTPNTVPDALFPKPGFVNNDLKSPLPNYDMFWNISLNPERIQEADEMARGVRSRRFDADQGIPSRFGSYAWVVSGSRTASGAPILVGGPQMGFDFPSIAHEVNLHGPNGEVHGMGIAGIPGVLIGHNGQIAWTTTSGLGDNTDLFAERLDPNSKYRYFYSGKYREMTKRIEVIKVKGEEPIEITCVRTQHGPVISWDEKNNIAYSKKMAFWMRELDTLVAIYGFSRSRTLDEFATYAEYVTTSHNFLAISMDGDIGYWFCGWYPIRSARSDPRLPQIGTGEYEWERYVDFADLPHAVNPPQGFLANWNNRPVYWWQNPDYRRWDVDQRVARIQEKLAADPLLTIDDNVEIMRDIANYDMSSRFVVKLIDPVIREPGLPDKVKRATRYLMAWSGQARDGSVAKSIQDEFIKMLREEIFMPVLGDFNDMGRFHNLIPLGMIIDALEKQNASGSYDYLTDRSQNDVIKSALSKSVSNLESRYGQEMHTWGYEAPIVDFGESGMIPDRNRGTYIQIIEMTPPTPNAYNILPPGQSENIDSPHHSDQTRLAAWWRFKRMGGKESTNEETNQYRGTD